MGEKANLSKKFLNEVCENYELGKPISSQKMHRGMMQSNFRLNSSKGKYVLRIYNQNKNFESIKFEINLLEYLKNNSFPSIGCLKNKEDLKISTSGSKKICCFRICGGKP